MACNQQQRSRKLTAARADKLRQLHVTDSYVVTSAVNNMTDM